MQRFGRFLQSVKGQFEDATQKKRWKECPSRATLEQAARTDCEPFEPFWVSKTFIFGSVFIGLCAVYFHWCGSLAAAGHRIRFYRFYSIQVLVLGRETTRSSDSFEVDNFINFLGNVGRASCLLYLNGSVTSLLSWGAESPNMTVLYWSCKRRPVIVACLFVQMLESVGL